jgi:hypothetical protein
MQRVLLATTTLLLGAWPATSAAAEPDASEASAAEPDPAQPEPKPKLRLSHRTHLPWIQRWAPERDTTEVGLYGGMLVTSRHIELFEADFGLPDQGYRPFARVAPAFGLRAGFLPIRWGGIELEAGAMPTHTELGQGALLWTARGALVGQLALWSVTPFVLVGGGLVGVSSDRSVVGNDVDVAMHMGGGVKVHLGRLTHVRLDVRDVVTARRGYKAGVSHSAEILLGVGITLGRRRDLEERKPPTHYLRQSRG